MRFRLGEGWGGGSGGSGKAVPHSTTPTPNPSPQGGGDEFAALLRRKLAPRCKLTPMSVTAAAKAVLAGVLFVLNPIRRSCLHMLPPASCCVVRLWALFATRSPVCSVSATDSKCIQTALDYSEGGGIPAAPAVAAPPIDGDDIGGIVTSRFGPEAGVWVVAETTELGTRFAKMAVTDERGRFVVPDLPKATYRVWVRGYGLVDSPKVTTEPGKILNLTAVIAPDPAAAAQYYPAIYWAAMIRVTDKSKFPATGADGNGIPVTFKGQDLWLNTVKTNGCGNCHQLGNYATRTIPEAL